MTRLLSSVVLAGALALSMTSVASAREGRHGDRHAPQCRNITKCDMKRTKWGRWKRVCVTKRVCVEHHGHGRGHH